MGMIFLREYWWEEGECVKKWFSLSDCYVKSGCPSHIAAQCCCGVQLVPRKMAKPAAHFCPGAVERVGRGNVKGPFVGFSVGLPFCEHLWCLCPLGWCALPSMWYSWKMVGVEDRQSHIQILAALPDFLSAKNCNKRVVIKATGVRVLVR